MECTLGEFMDHTMLELVGDMLKGKAYVIQGTLLSWRKMSAVKINAKFCTCNGISPCGRMV